MDIIQLYETDNTEFVSAFLSLPEEEQEKVEGMLGEFNVWQAVRDYLLMVKLENKKILEIERDFRQSVNRAQVVVDKLIKKIIGD